MTTETGTDNQPKEAPLWASWMGIIILLLGIFLAATSGTELLKQKVLYVPEVYGSDPALFKYRCPKVELELERISESLCDQMAGTVMAYLKSRPDWFRNLQMVLSTMFLLLGFCSIYVGIALIEDRSWSAVAAFYTYVFLSLLDSIGVLAVVNTSPLLKEIYMAQMFFWTITHITVMLALYAGLRESRDRRRTDAAAGV